MECGKVKDNVRDTFETRGKYPTSSVCFNEYVVSGKNSLPPAPGPCLQQRVAFRHEWTEEVKKAPSLNISEEKPPSPFRKNRSVDPGRLLRPGPLRGVWSPSRITDFKKIPAIPAAASAPCRLRRNCRAEASRSYRKLPTSTGNGAALNFPSRMEHAARYISRIPAAFPPPHPRKCPGASSW